MRKKILLVIAILGISLGSCNKEEDGPTDNDKASINLIAPNGQKIANDIETLTNLIAGIAEDSYGESKDIEISNIIYHKSSNGFIAEISYITYDGHSNNVIISNTSLEYDPKLNRIKTRSEDATDGITIYSCKNTDRKKCPDCEVGKSDAGVRCSCSKGDRSFCELKKREG